MRRLIQQINQAEHPSTLQKGFKLFSRYAAAKFIQYLHLIRLFTLRRILQKSASANRRIPLLGHHQYLSKRPPCLER